jgi:large subunit ribosomal protein L30
MSKKIKVQLIRSFYGYKDDQINTVRSLGLRRMNQVREHDDNAIIRGMIFKVRHLVKVI